MGGRIGVVDAPARGALFWVELELPVSRAAARPKRQDLSGVRVLIVDDIELNRTIYRLQLEDVGAQVEAVDSGPAALEAVLEAHAAGAPFDVVLLDQMMPDVSGAQAAAELQATEAGAGLAIVMSSSMSEPLTGREAAALGIQATLVKPVRHAHLVDTLCRVLDVADGAAEEAEPTTAAAAAEPVRLCEETVRVLLAEDNEINTLLACTILEQLGFSVTCVVNGCEALEAATASRFDLVLMDVQMPQMDGLEAARRIRVLEGPNAKVPIVAMTANAMREDREACLAAGMNAFVAKPVNAEVLISVLARILDDARPALVDEEAA